MFLCLLVKNLHESTKHSCFRVFSPFSAHLYPPLHHNGWGEHGQTGIYFQLQLVVTVRASGLQLRFAGDCPYSLFAESLERFLNTTRSLPMLLQVG